MVDRCGDLVAPAGAWTRVTFYPADEHAEVIEACSSFLKCGNRTGAKGPLTYPRRSKYQHRMILGSKSFMSTVGVT